MSESSYMRLHLDESKQGVEESSPECNSETKGKQVA